MTKSLRGLKFSSVIFTLLISIPMITIFTFLFSGDTENWNHVKETVLFDYIFNTLYIMIGVGLLTTLLGFSTAYLVSIYKFTGSRFFDLALVLPFAIPTYILAFIYNGMFGISGNVTGFILGIFDKNISELPFFWDIQSIEGAILVMSLVLYPYVYLVCRTYLSFESSSIIEAAQTFNLNTWQILKKVIIPISSPAIIAGVTLAIMEAVSDYGTMDYFGVNTFVTGIFRLWEGMGSIEDASKLASILMTFVFILIILERFQRRNKTYKSSGKDFRPITKIQLKGWHNNVAFIICFLPFFFGFLLPFIQLIFWFIESYKTVIDEEFLELLFNTILLGLMSAVIITSIALLVVYNYRMNKDKASSSFVQIIKLGYSIPGAVVAVGILSFFGIINELYLKLFDNSFLVSGTLIAILFGYLVRFISISINNFEAGFNRIPQSYDDAASISGVGSVKTFTKVFIPLIKNSAFASFIVIFIEVIKELPLTMVLRPFDYDTLAIRALELNEQAQTIQSAVPSLFIVLIAMISVILLIKNMKKA
ncbi:MAG: Sulfate transport system permease protein CysW [Arcobacter lacus]|nr:MAG: Sulfate transport system permease protein CysW [Arcobacter lacus]